MLVECRRVLVVRTGGLGDVLLALPAFRAIRSHMPDSHINVLASRGTAAFLQQEGLQDELLVFGRSPQRTGGFLCRSRFEQFSWLLSLRAQRYDAVVVLQPLLTAAGAIRLRCLTRLSGAFYTYGRNTNGRGKFYRQAYDERLDSDVHEVERCMAVVNLMGIDGPRDTSTAAAPMQPQLSELLPSRTSAGPLIGINAGSFRECYRWPSERFGLAADRLRRELGATIVLIGTDQEREIELSLLKHLGEGAVSLVGATDLLGLASVLYRLDLLLTNDTGTMHLAAALGTPLVAVFSPGDPRRTGPYAPAKRARVVTNHLCGLHSCRNRECMLNIGVDQVVEAALSVLKSSRPGASV